MYSKLAQFKFSLLLFVLFNNDFTISIALSTIPFDLTLSGELLVLLVASDSCSLTTYNVTTVIKHSSSHLYADVLQIYTHSFLLISFTLLLLI